MRVEGQNAFVQRLHSCLQRPPPLTLNTKHSTLYLRNLLDSAGYAADRDCIDCSCARTRSLLMRAAVNCGP